MADITRSYWVEAIQEENVKFVEKIFAALNKETGCDFAPNYTQSYIGASLNGKNSHLINVKQGKKGLRISTQVKQTAAIDSTLKSLAIDGEITYGSDGWYVFFVTNKIDIDKLVSVLKQSAIERGVKPTASKAAAPVAPVAEKPAKEKTAKAEKTDKGELDAAKAEIERLKAELAKAKKADKDEDKPAKKSKSNDPFEGLMVKVCAGMFRQDTLSDYTREVYPGGDHRKKPKTEWYTRTQSRRVTISKDFYICKYPVTQGQWKAIMGEGFNPSAFRGDDNLPVESVSWNDCQEFINKLNQVTGKKYRLPTEAEWQWAAMGASKDSDQGRYSGCTNEDDLGQYAWYNVNSGGKTHPVGQKKPNEIGLYDMCGNIREWCQDIYTHDSSTADAIDPVGPTNGDERVTHGGSFKTWTHSTCALNIWVRGSSKSRDSSIGFRIALTID